MNVRDVPCLSCQQDYSKPHHCEVPRHCPCDRSDMHTNADAAPTKQRPGDQALPRYNAQGASVQDEIIRQMEESKRVGVERYGRALHTFNGRRGLQDVLDEVRDLHVYLTQVLLEMEAGREQVIEVIAEVIASTTAQEEVPAEKVAEAVYLAIQGSLTPSRMHARGDHDAPGAVDFADGTRHVGRAPRTEHGNG